MSTFTNLHFNATYEAYARVHVSAKFEQLLASTCKAYSAATGVALDLEVQDFDNSQSKRRNKRAFPALVRHFKVVSLDCDFYWALEVCVVDSPPFPKPNQPLAPMRGLVTVVFTWRKPVEPEDTLVPTFLEQLIEVLDLRREGVLLKYQHQILPANQFAGFVRLVQKRQVTMPFLVVACPERRPREFMKAAAQFARDFAGICAIRFVLAQDVDGLNALLPAHLQIPKEGARAIFSGDWDPRNRALHRVEIEFLPLLRDQTLSPWGQLENVAWLRASLWEICMESHPFVYNLYVADRSPVARLAAKQRAEVAPLRGSIDAVVQFARAKSGRDCTLAEGQQLLLESHKQTEAELAAERKLRNKQVKLLRAQNQALQAQVAESQELLELAEESEQEQAQRAADLEARVAQLEQQLAEVYQAKSMQQADYALLENELATQRLESEHGAARSNEGAAPLQLVVNGGAQADFYAQIRDFQLPTSVVGIVKLLQAPQGLPWGFTRYLQLGDYESLLKGARWADRNCGKGAATRLGTQLKALVSCMHWLDVEGNSGGFVQYLRANHGGVTVSQSQFSAGESDTVMQDARMRAQRVFRVPTSVDSSGQMLMTAHFTVTSTRGTSARLYFHVDSQRKVVVLGYLGNHLDVKSTN